MPISPFDTDNGDASPPAVFCNRLEDGNIIIVSDVLESLDTPNWPYSRGECQGFYGEKMTKLGYNITIQLVYDSAGCDNNDKYATGINMTDYGWKNCRDVFHDKILNNCQFSDKTTDHLGLGDSNMVGGVYWQDCMRWTIISVKDDLSQIDTSPFT
ncbi:hypothetical protein H2200_006473 [Cladophialophora chaetospira]|uniref:Uncharacterized protein n=1 Tax=Cladophialophora chaetospira TaxID=386627 RepID=A0AA38X8U4_9EURO|nr:hypothetical protein H2200_006473 [Cladophialophora chaetospira]